MYPYLIWLDKLKSSGHYRKLSRNRQAKSYLDFTSNDYLGLARHEIVIAKAKEYLDLYGTGSAASPVVNYLDIYAELEEMIAKSKGYQAAMLFPSGYQANATVISALLDKDILGSEPAVFTDKLNHASMHHGCFLAGIRQIRYRNTDLDDLANKIELYQKEYNFILTESVFSMDGSITDIDKLRQISQRFHAFTYIDEAHATGLFGYGLAAGQDIAMGSFSKALGASGGYIACSQELKEYLVNRAKGFIYSTALSPAIIGAVTAAWQMIPKLTKEQLHLRENAQYLRNKLQEHGFNIGTSKSHIIPVIFGDSNKTMQIAALLLEKGIKVSAIRPPTVAPNSARLRIALTSLHTKEEIDYLLSTLQYINETLGA